MMERTGTQTDGKKTKAEVRQVLTKKIAATMLHHVSAL